VYILYIIDIGVTSQSQEPHSQQSSASQESTRTPQLLQSQVPSNDEPKTFLQWVGRGVLSLALWVVRNGRLDVSGNGIGLSFGGARIHYNNNDYGEPSAANSTPRMPTQQTGSNLNPDELLVDFLKSHGQRSNLNARSQLARDMNIRVGPYSSSVQNIAVHRALMREVNANGGRWARRSTQCILNDILSLAGHFLGVDSVVL